jgi:hypothetical protein
MRATARSGRTAMIGGQSYAVYPELAASHQHFEMKIVLYHTPRT